MRNSDNRRYFQWDILNPFLPWRKMEAEFHHGRAPATLWKVTLEPMGRGVNYWQFSFSLEFAEHTQIHADEILVIINLNGEKVADKREPNLLFSTENWFVYHFIGTVAMHPEMESHHLIIRIDMSLPGRATGNEVGNGLYFHDQDLKLLSVDMRKLLDSKEYHDMNFLSSDSLEPIPAHSYIVAARWDNFFTEHSFDANGGNPVETGMSYALLQDILVYMYSGELRRNWPDWEKADYIAELFHVINRYKLEHLYKVFLKDDFQYKRETRNSVLISSCRFPLHSVHGRPVNRNYPTWHVNPDPEYEFFFQIRVSNENLAGNWLSFSLQSKSQSRVYAQVNLEVVKKVEGDTFRSVGSFDGRDCTMDPDETVESGPVLFLGCPETFGDSHATEREYSVRCYLIVVNGETVEKVESVGDDTLEDESERFRVLSDHMYNLHQQKIHSDMTICSKPRFPGDDIDRYRIHKGILAARSPLWRNGFRYPFACPIIEETHSMPHYAISTLGRLNVRSVLDYMYTGKILNYYRLLNPEVQQFVERTMFESLRSLLERIPRSTQMNQNVF